MAYSGNTTVKGNKISNAQIGVFVQSGSNNTVVTRNEISYNRVGAIDQASHTTVYLNNFRNNIESDVYVYWDGVQTDKLFSSRQKITYAHEDETFTNYLGNYWTIYSGNDRDGDGIGDTPYPYPSVDEYPLMEPFENYVILVEPPLLELSVHNLNTGKDYFSIQTAIDDPTTLDGHIILFGPRTYWENVRVYKSLMLTSESGPTATIFHARETGYAFEISANFVQIHGFTIRGGSSYTTMYLKDSDYCSISDNVISGGVHGVYLYSSNNTVISNNNILTGLYGIYQYSSNATISNNKISSIASIAVFVESNSNNTMVTRNDVSNSRTGIVVHGYYTTVYLNNFRNNSEHNAHIYFGFPELNHTFSSREKISYVYKNETYMNYLGNYWDDYAGSDVNEDGIGDSAYISNPDWSKAIIDNYPLMESFENYFAPPPPPEKPPRFLTLPFKDPDIKIQQSWVYTFDPDPEAHKGIDYIKGISDQSSTWQSFDVVATADGIAMQSSGGEYGTFVYIQHNEKDSTGNNYFTLYAHLDSVATGIVSKPRGDADYSTWTPVKRGEVIGKAGATGVIDPTWIHLHFEVQRGGYPLGKTDPYDLYKTRDFYPGGDKYAGCGPNYLWTTDPPSLPENQPPLADAGLDQSVFSGDLVQFDGSNSYDPDGTIVGYQWIFGDGETAEGPVVEHRFRGAMDGSKTYTVTLTVEDNNGAVATDTASITVKPLRKMVDVGPGHFGVSCWMEATYNWVGTDEATGENLYIISRIDSYSGGFAGAYQLFILRRVSPPPSWPKVIWHIALPSAPIMKTYTTPFTPSAWQKYWGTPAEPVKHTFSEGTFEGIEVTDTSLMVIVATGTEAFPLLYYDAGLTRFEPGFLVIHLKAEELKELWELKDVIDLLSKIVGMLFSPGELRIYDLEGRVTGLVNGEIKEEIPGSMYVDGTFLILHPGEPYHYEIVSTDRGTYKLMIISVENATAATFTATDIPVSANSIHQYTIDWAALSEGEDGVTVQIDSDGDGMFEHVFTSDSELTQSEYVTATDKTPPTTTLFIGEPKYVAKTAYVTPNTAFTLESNDNGGSGVQLTSYRIRNSTYNGGWLTYTTPFYLASLSNGVYTIEFNSTDNAGNIEATQTIPVTLFSWNYVFTDSYGRGTTLKINTEHKLFQFITPDKDYGIRKATYMHVLNIAIIINHKDSVLKLDTLSIDTRIDFCIAYAKDMQTRKEYWLIDKTGTEK